MALSYDSFWLGQGSSTVCISTQVNRLTQNREKKKKGEHCAHNIFSSWYTHHNNYHVISVDWILFNELGSRKTLNDSPAVLLKTDSTVSNKC